MWRKPEINKPNFKKRGFEKLSKKELENLLGGETAQEEDDDDGHAGIGVCVVLGHACWTKAGGFQIGVCYVVGGYF